MTERQISTERVKAIIAAYGTDPARWPKAERANAVSLLEDLADKMEGLPEAAGLDASLESVAQPRPSNMLKARLLEDASLAIMSAESGVRTGEPSGLRGLAGLIEWFADFVGAPASLKPLAVSTVMVPALALGIWVGIVLTSEPLGEEELFTAFGEDYELWTEGDLPEPFDPLSELTGETG